MPPHPGDTGCGEEDPIALYLFEGPWGIEGDEIRDHGAAPPLHLVIRDPEAVEWQASGLEVVSETLITSKGDTSKLLEGVHAAGVITVEAWVTITEPSYDHTGPARIVSLSRGTRSQDRNVLIGQEVDASIWDSVALRVRNPDDPTRRSFELTAAHGLTVRERAHHIVATVTETEMRLSIDGAPFYLSQGADFGNWPRFPLNLANEFSEDDSSERPFFGRYHRVAIYARDMTFDEVECRAGERPPGVD